MTVSPEPVEVIKRAEQWREIYLPLLRDLTYAFLDNNANAESKIRSVLAVVNKQIEKDLVRIWAHDPTFDGRLWAAACTGAFPDGERVTIDQLTDYLRERGAVI